MVQRRINLLAPNLSVCVSLICEPLVLLQLGEDWGGFPMYDVQCRAQFTLMRPSATAASECKK